MLEKTCTKCHTLKPILEFGIERPNGKRRAQCDLCKNKYRKIVYKRDPKKHLALAKKWQAANPDKVIETRYRKFGITSEMYNSRFAEQGGLCKICHLPSKKALCVDHDHVTQEVRGLLCHSCNVGLGHFRDDPELLMQAISYLAKAA